MTHTAQIRGHEQSTNTRFPQTPSNDTQKKGLYRFITLQNGLCAFVRVSTADPRCAENMLAFHNGVGNHFSPIQAVRPFNLRRNVRPIMGPFITTKHTDVRPEGDTLSIDAHTEDMYPSATWNQNIELAPNLFTAHTQLHVIGLYNGFIWQGEQGWALIVLCLEMYLHGFV